MIIGAIWVDQPMWFDFEKLEQLLDLLGAEPAHVSFVVDVAGRRPDEHQLAEHAGRLPCGEHADHAADGMPDEDRILQP